MQRTLVKLVVALTLSLGCFGITHWLYLLTAPTSEKKVERNPIAFVSERANDVQRRPLKRTIWQELENGEPVYTGEAIRTASRSEARLRFAGSGQTLDIEPDSLIVLSANQNEVSLELMDGSIFVAQSEVDQKATDQKLTLKSSGGAIDLSKATASLSKSEGESVNLQILRGSATTGTGQSLEQGQGGTLSGGRTELNSFHLQILSPQTDGSVLYVSEMNPTGQKFAWSGAQPNAKVELWLGTSRKTLELKGVGSGETGRLELPLSVGRFYWKFVHVPSQGGRTESNTFRLETKALAVPAIIQPLKDQLISLSNPSDPVTFSWSVPENASEVTLEISADRSFKNTLVSERFPTSQTHIERILKSGQYYWRLSAYYPDVRQMAAGPALPFEVWIKPPKHIQISWNTDQTVYYPLQPEAALRWNSTPDPDIKRWRLRIGPNAEALQARENQDRVETEVTNPEASINLPRGGRWIASVEALDEKGNILSKSDPHSFDLHVLPLLKAPAFLPLEGNLEASSRGELNLRWDLIPGAQLYEVRFMDERGRLLSKQELKGNTTSLRNLMPGSYQVEVQARDEYGRASELQPPRRINVPEKSGLSAPKFKKVQVK